MKKTILFSFLFIQIAGTADAQQSRSMKPGTIALSEGKRVMLPNGWSLSPAGRSLELGDLPLNIAVSASQRLMAVTNNGQGRQTIQLIDPVKEKVLHSVEIPKSFYGLAFSKDEKFLYASGGNDNWILKYAIESRKASSGAAHRLVLADSIKLGARWPEKISPVGMTISSRENKLFIVTKENNSLYTVDLTTQKLVQVEKLGSEAYTCVLSQDEKLLYVSLWGGRSIAIVDTKTGKRLSEIKVSYNPNELILSKSGLHLFVANAGDNSVSVINTQSKQVVEVLNTALYPASPAGSVPNGLALSADERTLYIANADNNTLAVFNVSTPGRSRSKGFIPVGWYPTSVRVVNKKIFVANGKGFTSFANPLGPQPVSRAVQSESHRGETVDANNRLQYIGNLMKGTMSIIEEPDAKTLSIYSKQVYRNTPYTKSKELVVEGDKGGPIPMRVGDPSPIKYIFYILKENRTYDQVFGDMPEGNGDSSLCLFGEKYTPNQHKLAREYVLLDNFYVDAEVSADGHNWSMGAHANDFLEKTWPTSYGRRGGSNDGLGRREVANNKDGYIWDFCKRAGVSYRTYGVFQDKEEGNIPSLKGHEAKSFPTYYLSNVRDTARVQRWKQDFDSLLSINQVPQFNSIRLGADHTQGLAVGRPTPYACVADNDLAVGLLVEHLSKSRIWKETAIFILEDDAQNGPDHVDAHRSNALVISPYVKRGVVDHTMYSTSGMLRTIELILGLPPMTQYDAAATPMWRSFLQRPTVVPYAALPSNVNLNDTNSIRNSIADASAKLDFSEVDKIDDHVFNQILWKGLRGEGASMPAPRRSAFVYIAVKPKEKD